jgi:HD superfamily phosphohydrolase
MDLEFTTNIRHTVHGPIYLANEERKIIDHELFHRLSWIRQLALLGDIFPGAMHTRFAHSLGVVHMVQEMLKALFEQSKATRSKLYPIEEAQTNCAVKIHEINRSQALYLQRIARLCGLVHDLGHGPCSHAFETFSATTESVKVFFDDPRLKILQPIKEEILKGHNGQLTHESVSALFFAVIWHEIGGYVKEPWMPLVVASVLLGKDNVPGIPTELYEIIPLCRDIVSSSPIDADRMEYLIHDSTMCGVSYGHHERHRILKSILVFRSEVDGKRVLRLGWRDSGLRAIEGFLFARFQMFIEIYHHKTNRAKELMLEAIAEFSREKNASVIDVSTLDSFMESYTKLSDEMFVRMLAGQIEKGRITDDRVIALGKNLLKRKFWRRLYEFKRTEFANADELLREMQKKYPGRDFFIDRKAIDAVKGIEKGAALLDLNATGKYSVITDDTWFDLSATLEMLRDKEKWLIRLYVKIQDPDSESLKNKMRTDALASAAAIRAARRKQRNIDLKPQS